MLINLSNHPSSNWSKAQLDCAEFQFGEVVDLTFPNVNPAASKDEVAILVDEYIGKCLSFIDRNNPYVSIHVMGEMTFTFAFVASAKNYKSFINIVASTTERKSSINPDGTKNVSFVFVRFRPY